jgi:hypothetical protein
MECWNNGILGLRSILFKNVKIHEKSKIPRVKTLGFFVDISLYVATTCHAPKGVCVTIRHPGQDPRSAARAGMTNYDTVSSAGMTEDTIHSRFKKRGILAYLHKQ